MNFFLFEDEVDMPEELLSEDGELFQNCKQCGESLQNPPQPYTLEKVFKRYPNSDRPQVLFEYAVCDNCSDNIREEFSEESAQKMQGYFSSKLAERSEEPEEANITDRLTSCLITNKPLLEEQEYAVVARGKGTKMLKSHYPFAIGVTAMDEMQELLSAQTRDLLDDFVERNFPGPPAFENVPVDGKWVMV